MRMTLMEWVRQKALVVVIIDHTPTFNKHPWGVITSAGLIVLDFEASVTLHPGKMDHEL
jgi:hypothetical protein